MFSFLILVLAGAVIFGCGRVVTDSGGQPTPQSYGVLMGTVKNTAGTALSAVTVTAAGTSAATNAQGWFAFSNLSASTREVVTFSQSGFISTQRIAQIAEGQATFLDVTMAPAGSTQTMNAAAGGTVTAQTSTLLTASVSIPANALVDASGTPFTGTASIVLTPFDPTVTSEIDAFPGDFEGVSTSGITQQFKSFGFMDVNITGSGPLYLGAGKTAMVTIPVPPGLTPEAASAGTCPLWYYDEADGKWKQEGTGTYDAAQQAFVGSVSHFSTWNFDLSFPRAYISGRVVDSNGDPVLGAEVRGRGLGWSRSRWESGDTTTGTDGRFSRIPVESDVSFDVWAQKGGKKSAVSVKGPYASNSETDIGDVVIDAPVVHFTLTWGQNPADLDSHLTIPSTGTTTLGAERGHLWYPYTVDKGYDYLATQYPHAILDTDDTSSYGPEVTSIYRLYPGTYRFCIHHFSGSSSISDSGANVNLIVSGGGRSAIYNFTPPAGGAAVNDVWRVVDVAVDSSGNISSVDILGDFLQGVSASSSEAFSPNNEATYRGPNGGITAQVLSIKK